MRILRLGQRRNGDVRPVLLARWWPWSLCIVLAAVTAACDRGERSEDSLASAAEAKPRRIEVPNGSLEERDETGRPRGWGVVPHEAIAVVQEEESDVFDGKHTLFLKSLPGTCALAFAELAISPEDQGKTLRVTAMGRVNRADGASISLEADVNGKRQQLGKWVWPACSDEWTRVAVKAVLPKDPNLKSVHVRVMLSNRPGISLRLDDVQATIQ